MRVGEPCAVKVCSLPFFASSVNAISTFFFFHGQAVNNTVRFVFEGVIFFSQQDEILQMVLKLFVLVAGPRNWALAHK